jgi:hypothetical protein
MELDDRLEQRIERGLVTPASCREYLNLHREI